jgi:hypothetical protein
MRTLQEFYKLRIPYRYQHKHYNRLWGRPFWAAAAFSGGIIRVYLLANV